MMNVDMNWSMIMICLLFAGPVQAQDRTCGGSPVAPDGHARINETYDQVLYVPVVVHVVYSTPEQNISYEQIRSQLVATNNDFRRRNADTTNTLPVFREVAADSRIEFYLSDGKDQSYSNGIIRVATDHGPFFNEDIHYTDRGGSSAVNPSEVLNIWVADLGGTMFAYSKSTPVYPAEEDGVVVDYAYFGTMETVRPPFDQGRTVTHELGHWLGLPHPWGDKNCADGDSIGDTPVQENGSFGCDLERMTCGSLDMVQNFMSLSDDACMNLFTRGQADVMRTRLLSKTGIYKERIPLEVTAFADDQIVIFPNPSEGVCNIQFAPETGVDVLFLTDASGKPVEFLKSVSHEGLIRIELLQSMAGVYFLTIETDRATIKRRVITKIQIL